MIVHKGYENLILRNPVVTLGIFDGVHKGHWELLKLLVARAQSEGGESVAITFNPHPRLVLSPDRENLSFLTTLDEKMMLLERSGIDHLIVIEFNEHIRNMGACEFIGDILVGKIGIKHLVVGYDHHFGKGREGDFVMISECAGRYGFTVEKVNEVHSGDVIVSSTAIRDALLKGRIEEANELLGYCYSLGGVVVHGRRIGMVIGFPTANIEPSDRYKLIPADGVYAVGVEIKRLVLKGMLSIGSNPTVNEDPHLRSVEVHIFDLNKDLYGENIRIDFRYRLRDEIKFDSISRLVRQMELDRQQSLRLLS